VSIVVRKKAVATIIIAAVTVTCVEPTMFCPTLSSTLWLAKVAPRIVRIAIKIRAGHILIEWEAYDIPIVAPV